MITTFECCPFCRCVFSFLILSHNVLPCLVPITCCRHHLICNCWSSLVSTACVMIGRAVVLYYQIVLPVYKYLFLHIHISFIQLVKFPDLSHHSYLNLQFTPLWDSSYYRTFCLFYFIPILCWFVVGQKAQFLQVFFSDSYEDSAICLEHDFDVHNSNFIFCRFGETIYNDVHN